MHPCISAVPAWKHVFRHSVGLIDSVKLRKFTFSKWFSNCITDLKSIEIKKGYAKHMS